MTPISTTFFDGLLAQERRNLSRKGKHFARLN